MSASLAPDFGIVVALAPVGLQVLIVDGGEVAVDPGGQVDAVGDGGDGDFPDRKTGPQVFPHFLRDLAVQAADGVAEGGGLHGEDGHGKRFVGIGACGASQSQECIQIDAGLSAVELEVFADQAGVEAVKAGGDGGVGGENVVGARGVQGFVESQTLFGHQDADALDGQERRVAFVHVIDGGVESQGFERAQAADAEDDFLANALEIVAAVELVGDFAMLVGGILRDVAVEQIQFHAAHLDAPDFEEDFVAAEVDADQELAASGTRDGRDGERIEIVDGGAFLLPAVGVEFLLQEAVLIEQADADEREQRRRWRL